jgi:hypothetical protein
MCDWLAEYEAKSLRLFLNLLSSLDATSTSPFLSNFQALGHEVH